MIISAIEWIRAWLPKRRPNFAARVMILIALILAIDAAKEVYDAVDTRGAREADLRAQVVALARIAALDMERTLEGARQMMSVASKSRAVRDRDLNACNALLTGVNRDLPMYDFISADELDGTITCGSSVPPAGSGIRTDRGLIDRVAETRGFIVGTYGRGKIKGNEVIRLGFPIFAAHSSISGVLVAGLNLSWLNASIADWQLPANAVVDVADRNGILIARHPDPNWVGQALPEGLQTALNSVAADTRFARGLDGVSRLYGYVPVSLGSTHDIVIMVGLDYDGAIGAIDHMTWWNLGWSLALLLGAAVTARSYVRRFVERPMNHLLNVATRWQAGDWTARARADCGVREIEDLGKAFDIMAESVAGRECALRTSEQHLARAQRVAAIGSFERDFRTDRIEWSDETYRIFGVSRDAGPLSAAAVEERVVPEDRTRFGDAIRLAWQGLIAPPGEYRIRRADGAVRTIYREIDLLRDSAGNAVAMIGVLKDVTELREKELELRRSREHLARAQRVAAIGSFEIDFRRNRHEWSDETYRIFGISRDFGPISTDAVEAMVLPEDRERFRETILRAREGEVSPAPEYRIRRPDGVVRTIYREVDLVRDEAGNAIGFIGVAKDVTELREAERQRDQLEHQLQQSQKLEALGTLAGGIAHDLNNALVPILGLSKMVLGDLPVDSDNRQDLETIVHAALHAKGLVQQILAFSRHQEAAKTAVDLAPTLRRALQMLRATIPATVRLNETIKNVPLIIADVGQLEQVVVNLVSNAVQAIGNNIGTVAVELSLDRPEPDNRDTGDFIHLCISDTGCGMDRETVDRIFEPFFTTKPVGEGTGLGLSVVHGIVVGHGGRINVSSTPGQGTVFSICLPVCELPASRIDVCAA